MRINKIRFYLFILLAVFACSYSIFWINVGYEAKRTLRMLFLDVEDYADWRINYDGMRLGRFPWAFSINIDNLRVQGAYDPTRGGNYEMRLGNVAIDADLLLREFKTKLDHNINYVVLVDTNEGQHLFNTMINYRPKLNVQFNRSLMLSMFKSNTIKRLGLELRKLEYQDQGYEALDDERNVLYALRGKNQLNILVNISHSKRSNGEVKDVIAYADINIKPEYSDFYSDTNSKTLPVLTGHAFALRLDGELRLPSRQSSKNNLYTYIKNITYLDENFSAELSGAGGLIPQAGMVGEFRLDIRGYDAFFKNALHPLFAYQESYESFRNKIMSISDKIEGDNMYLVYRADDESNARIGTMGITELVLFSLEKLGVDPTDLSRNVYNIKERILSKDFKGAEDVIEVLEQSNPEIREVLANAP